MSFLGPLHTALCKRQNYIWHENDSIERLIICLVNGSEVYGTNSSSVAQPLLVKTPYTIHYVNVDSSLF